MKQPLLVYGTSSFSHVVVELAKLLEYKIAGYIDDYRQGVANVFSSQDAFARFAPKEFGIALAVGYKDLPKRKLLLADILERGFDMPNLIHPTSYISNSAAIGSGNILMANVVVDSFAVIKDGCVMWPQAALNHHSLINSNTFCSPASVVCGNAEVGHSTFLGASSVVVDGALLPPNSFVKMNTSYSQRRNP